MKVIVELGYTDYYLEVTAQELHTLTRLLSAIRKIEHEDHDSRLLVLSREIGRMSRIRVIAEDAIIEVKAA